jgi:hypothetical protein
MSSGHFFSPGEISAADPFGGRGALITKGLLPPERWNPVMAAAALQQACPGMNLPWTLIGDSLWVDAGGRQELKAALPAEIRRQLRELPLPDTPEPEDAYVKLARGDTLSLSEVSDVLRRMMEEASWSSPPSG